VDLETEPVAGTTDQVDITVRVKERPTGNILFGVGFSSAERFIVSGSITQQNLFGSGNALSLQIASGSISRTYALSYTNPYWTVDGVSRGFDIYDRRFDPQRLGIGNYRTDTRGGGVRFGYPLTEIDTLNFGLAFERTEIDVFENTPQRFKDYVERFGSSSTFLIATTGWARDGRDSALWPTRGSLQRISLEGSMPGGEVRYYKAGYTHTFFYPLSRDYTLALTGDIGYAGGYSNQPLPFFKAYYAGGPTTVRGYAQSSLGPRDPNGVLGGSRKLIGSMELLFPFPGLGQDRTARLGWFADAGQVWNPDIPGGSLREVKFRYSTGLSFSWISPIGPLKMSFGIPLRTQPDDRTQRFQFLLGTVF
jgi:outer membrane protein insertion porin family